MTVTSQSWDWLALIPIIALFMVFSLIMKILEPETLEKLLPVAETALLKGK